MWILGIGFCVFGSGLNTLYDLRKPSITLSQSAIQLLAYPFGKFWEKVMPNWHFRLWRWTIHLNPGPFNQKACSMAFSNKQSSADVKGIFQEHILIYIMSNLSLLSRLSADVLTEQQAFYGYNAG